MTEANLDLRITLKANEDTLRAIRDKLISGDDEAQQLTNKISEMAKQTLIAAGLADTLNVDFNCGYISSIHSAGGGLSSQEWLSTDTPPQDITEPHSAKKYSYVSDKIPSGGLDAQEWMDTETPPEDLDAPGTIGSD
ncbi:MAG: hypothetical protein KDI79_25210 [Anaerolineae bacterium]|nr:hypothetical protein [Anaerolineae bacterium]